MGKPFYDRLQSYYSKVGKVLKGEAEAASIFPNSTDIGVARERIYAEILKQHLPSSCNVFLGGFIFDLDGNESKQIDVIISNEQSIRFNFHNEDGVGKSFSCIEGCLGVVSVKSNLNTAELIDSLENIASLPEKRSIEGRHNPLIEIKEYEEWPYKVIFASDGASLETITSGINNYYRANPMIPYYKRPNIIHVVGKYLIIRIGVSGGENRDGHKIAPHTFYGQTHFPDEFGIPYVVGQIQKISTATNHMVFSFDDVWNKLPLT